MTHRHHGGRIEIETALGRGTTFCVYLPAGQTPTSVLAESVKVDLPTLRVLYIDDDSRVRTVISDMLKQLGQTVDLAETGAVGLAKFRSNDYDLVITDLGMPDMHGYDLVGYVKRLNPSIPIIMVTGWGKSLSEETPTQRIEPDFTLAKPPTLAMLRDAIARVTAYTRS